VPGPDRQVGRLAPLLDASDCFETQGLTKTYNALEDPENADPRIAELRELHLEMDRAVLAAYGWGDIAVPPFTDPVTEEEKAARQAFEDEVLDRLFALNAERAAEESMLG